nr:keratin, type I cytoskeletal 10-like [Aegilops tauschii subsp. strangulata]
MRALSDELAAAGSPITEGDLLSFIIALLDYQPLISALDVRTAPLSVDDIFGMVANFDQRIEMFHGTGGGALKSSANAASRGRGNNNSSRYRNSNRSGGGGSRGGGGGHYQNGGGNKSGGGSGHYNNSNAGGGGGGYENYISGGGGGGGHYQNAGGGGGSGHYQNTRGGYGGGHYQNGGGNNRRPYYNNNRGVPSKASWKKSSTWRRQGPLATATKMSSTWMGIFSVRENKKEERYNFMLNARKEMMDWDRKRMEKKLEIEREKIKLEKHEVAIKWELEKTKTFAEIELENKKLQIARNVEDAKIILAACRNTGSDPFFTRALAVLLHRPDPASQISGTADQIGIWRSDHRP